jgi:hypothetical protein
MQYAMKYFIYLLFTLFILAVPVVSQNLTKGFVGSLSGGLSVPVEKLRTYHKSFHAAGNIGYKWYNAGFLLDAGYQNFRYGDDDLDYHIASISPQFFVGDFSDFVNPYAKLGIGLYVISRKLYKLSNYYNVQPRIGFNGSLGVVFKINNSFGIMMETGYNRTFEDGELFTYMPFKTGIFFQQNLK